MNKKIIFTGLIFILLSLSISGCMEYFNLNDESTTYESHPTSIRYKISYGYFINCSGTGNYKILYDCDKPDEYITSKISSLKLLYNNYYDQKTLFNNEIISWNISENVENDYKLGITANIDTESYMVTDLNGNNAATIDEIQNNYPDIYNQYTEKQSVDNLVYIDPYNTEIKLIAENVLNQINSNNSFLAAKELFIWLKQNTEYTIHLTGDGSVQPASQTIKPNCRKGDCDDLSFLYISLCRSINIPARFIRGFLVDEDNGDVNAVAHAWVEVFVGNNIGDKGWIPVECAGIATGEDKIKTEVNQNFGVERAGHLRLFTDEGSDESLNISISGPLVQYAGTVITMSPFVNIDNYIIIEEKELFIDENENRIYKAV